MLFSNEKGKFYPISEKACRSPQFFKDPLPQTQQRQQGQAVNKPQNGVNHPEDLPGRAHDQQAQGKEVQNGAQKLSDQHKGPEQTAVGQHDKGKAGHCRQGKIEHILQKDQHSAVWKGHPKDTENIVAGSQEKPQEAGLQKDPDLSCHHLNTLENRPPPDFGSSL